MPTESKYYIVSNSTLQLNYCVEIESNNSTLEFIINIIIIVLHINRDPNNNTSHSHIAIVLMFLLYFIRCVRLRGALVGIDDEDDSTFTITVDNKTFHFQAKDSEEREKWIRALGNKSFSNIVLQVFHISTSQFNLFV